MKLNKNALALSAGITIGIAMLVITFVFVIFDYKGEQLTKLNNLFFGYNVTWWGAFLGLIWGFIYGFIGGWVLAWLYNKFEK